MAFVNGWTTYQAKDERTTVYVINAHVICINIYNMAISCKALTRMSAVINRRHLTVQPSKIDESGTLNIMRDEAQKIERNNQVMLRSMPCPLYTDVIAVSHVLTHARGDRYDALTTTRVGEISRTLAASASKIGCARTYTYFNPTECTFFLHFHQPGGELHTPEFPLAQPLEQIIATLSGFEMINTVVLHAGYFFRLPFPAISSRCSFRSNITQCRRNTCVQSSSISPT